MGYSVGINILKFSIKFYINYLLTLIFLGNSSNSFLNNNQKGFENSEDEGSDFTDPEQEIEIKGNNSQGKKSEVQIEVNEKALKIPIPEFFIYDFKVKKYTNIGKGDFTIEYDKKDEKKASPLLIFRNSVLKILFQGIYRGNLTKLETVNKNFKTISIIQKVLVIDQETKKPDFKSVKLIHNNDQEAKNLLENFKEMEKNFELEEKNKDALNAAKNTSANANTNNRKTSNVSTRSNRSNKSNSNNKNEINQVASVVNNIEEKRNISSNLKNAENNNNISLKKNEKNVQFEEKKNLEISNANNNNIITQNKVNFTKGKIVNITVQIIPPSNN